MAQSFRWLHLTDLHLGAERYRAHWPVIRETFFDDLRDQLSRTGGVDAVVVSGDFVDRGAWGTCRGIVDDFLGEVDAVLSEDGASPAFVAVPGNHDLTRTPGNAARALLNAWPTEAEFREEFWSEGGSLLRKMVDEAFAPYLEWWNSTPLRRPRELRPGLLPGEFSATVESPSGLKVGLVALNSSFLTITGKNEGLDIHVRQLHESCGGDPSRWRAEHDACLLITHHPPERLSTEAREHFRTEIAYPGRFAAHLCGDLHEGAQRTESDGGAVPRRTWRGASLFGMGEGSRIHGYSVGEIRVDAGGGEGRIRQWPRRAVDRPQWRFVGDVDCRLEADEGMPAEPFPLVRAPRRPAPAPAGGAPGGAPDGEEREILEAYLDWVIRGNETLQLRGLPEAGATPEIELERVYVALRGTRSTRFEREASRALAEREAAQLQPVLLRVMGSLERLHTLTDAERQQLMRDLQVCATPMMLADAAAPRSGDDGPRTLHLAEAFCAERRIVILGDPGSGKTTVMRWLALRLARALRAGEARVRVPVDQVDPTHQGAAVLEDIGLARLPILVRVAELATVRAATPAHEHPPTLLEFLERHAWRDAPPVYGENAPRHLRGTRIDRRRLGALLARAIAEGRAVVLLDGLDEVVQAEQRDDVVRAVSSFMSDHVREDGAPRDVGGNQLVVTSRIVGYAASPLSELVHFTVEPMGRAAIDRFCAAWTRSVNRIAMPRAPEEEVERKSAQHTQALLAAIHDEHHPGRFHLATNPLLLTVMATVYQQRSYLPEQRTRLFQIAIEYLVGVWRRTSLSMREVVYVLEPLAFEIHEKYSTNNIPETLLRRTISRHLAYFRRMDAPDDPPPAFETEVDAFLESVRERVGLLAERGKRVYGFLHLNFQEYLAARYLLRGRGAGVRELLERIDQPRWREPVLMAVGYASTDWEPTEYEELLHAFLAMDDAGTSAGTGGDGRLRQILPRGSLTLVAALPEVAHMPARVVREIGRRLLITVAALHQLRLGEPFTRRVDGALAELHRFHAGQMEDLLVEALAQPGGGEPLDLAAATAIRRLGWFSPRLVAALSDALAHDDEAWGWPVDQALRAAAVQGVELPCRLQAALLANPQWAEAIAADPAWLRMVGALYGGFGDAGLPENLRRYFVSARLLQFGGVFPMLAEDADDPVYQLAVLLDTTLGKAIKRRHEVPRFAAASVYRDPADPELGNRIRALLERGEGPLALRPALQRTWREAASPDARAEAVVALALLGEPVEEALRDAPADVRHRAAALLGRVGAALDDPAIRAAEPSVKDAVARPAPPKHWSGVVASLLQVAVRSGSLPVLLLQAIEDRGDLLSPADRAYATAETWCAWLSVSDDVVYSVAVVLDTLGKVLSSDVDAFADAFLALPRARNLRSEFVLVEAAELLPPVPRTQEERISEAIDVIASLPEEVAFLRFWGLREVLAPAVARLCPHLATEIEAALLGMQLASVVEYLAPGLLDGAGALEPLVRQAQALDDAEARARALWRLATVIPGRRDTLARESFQAACAVADPHGRARLLERLVPLLRDAREELLARGTGAARAVADPHNRARALARWARLADAGERAGLLRDSLSAAARVEPLADRAELLRLMAGELPGDGSLAAAYDAAVASIGDPWFRDLACSRAGGALLRYTPAGGEADAAGASWSVLAAAGIVRDLQDRVAPALEGERLWERMIGDPAGADAEPLLRSRPVDGWRLRQRNAEAIDALLGAGRVDAAVALLRLLRDPEVATLARVEGWREHPDPRVVLLACVLLAEAGRFDLPLVDPLVRGIVAADDRTRYRVHSIFYNPQSSRHTLALGKEVMDRLAQHVVETSETAPIIPLVVRWMWERLTHSHRVALDAWADEVARGGEGAEPARILLAFVERTEPSLFESCFLRHLSTGPAAVQQPLLRSLLSSASLRSMDVPALRTTLHRLVRTGEKPVRILAIRAFGHSKASAPDLALLREVFDGGGDPAVVLEAGIAMGRLVRRGRVPEKPAGAAANAPPLPSLRDPAVEALLEPLHEALRDGGPRRSAALAGLAQAALGSVENGLEPAALTDLIHEAGGDAWGIVRALMEAERFIQKWTPAYRFSTARAASLVESYPEVLRLLLAELEDSLSRGTRWQGDFWLMQCLDVASLVAARMPSAYAMLAGDHPRLEHLLVDACCTHDSFPGRGAAIRLLSRLRRPMTAQTVEAFVSTLRDVPEVQAAAIQSARNFTSVTDELLHRLYGMLDDDSAVTAYAASEILVMLGRREETTPERRRSILAALAQAIDAPGAYRMVLRMEPDRGSQWVVHSLGPLNEVLYRAILRITA
jgi:hypothetical protein